ncbi:MAG: hypothetical protein QF819_06785 [Gemmatimonadota bacterium]|nr:hypothetical protein [Gemmatimonadota bacterium]MDP6460296.1 hypothetical protein [Gemmatimonadota bacterium]MDP6529176.1 hypothetical protein [Gemmatimonadota bacterium]MDP6802865.1 hypothetical protein [Gemmatimonadota bacterium]MDP7032189.1 hypothetical protein [Gemmatimonadota bacterium]
MIRCALPALTLCALVGSAVVDPAGAFELPGLGALLGTEDPLAAFPDSLPREGVVRAGYAHHLLYRSTEGDTRHHYATTGVWGMVLARGGPRLWFGARASGDRVTILQREVHGPDDALDGRRPVEHISMAWAARRGRWEARGLLGGAGGTECALEVRGAWGALERVEARAWLARTETRLSQRVSGSLFRFPVRLRDEVGEAHLGLRPILGVLRVEASARRRRVAGERTDPETWNLPFIAVDRLSARLSAVRGPQVDLRASREVASVDLAMASGGTRYLDAGGVETDRRTVEAGWRPGSRLRVSGGVDRWRVRGGRGFAEIWPFSVWEIFRSTRYRLVSVDAHWEAIYARVEWSTHAWRSLRLRIDGRFEKWKDHGRVAWEERVPVVYPFYFTYEAHEAEFDTHAPWGAQLDLELTWSPRPGWTGALHARSVAPLGDDRPEADAPPGPPGPPPPPSPPSEKKRILGGLSLAASVARAW